ncbi:MAG: hypothetical protein IKV75_04435 [Bacteroidales bacterium]|nr:hypothetical protein [Bacteroidales bacterium]
MSWFRNIRWKAIGKAIGAFVVSLGRGDLLLRMRVDKALPYILYGFLLGCISIWMSYQTEQTMLKVQKNNETLRTLKIQNAQMTYELVGLDRLSTVENMLEAMGSEVKAPTKPADILK